MDKIVSSTYYEGVVLIFTERGTVYVLCKDHTRQIQIQRTMRVELEP